MKISMNRCSFHIFRIFSTILTSFLPFLQHDKIFTFSIISTTNTYPFFHTFCYYSVFSSIYSLLVVDGSCVLDVHDWSDVSPSGLRIHVRLGRLTLVCPIILIMSTEGAWKSHIRCTCTCMPNVGNG